ncbi:hypothetical protein V1282_001874 [Nitrobacteraceae bacterium AZCC 2146]
MASGPWANRPVRAVTGAAFSILPRARDGLEILFAMIFLFLAQCADQGLRATGKPTVPNEAILVLS